MYVRSLAVSIVLVSAAWALADASSFVNWENPHVHPVDITPDGARLVLVNTPDARLEVFDLTSDWPESLASIRVGLDPVSVRARNDNEVWVVNHISDTISIVRLDTLHVVATLPTDDEPTDVVFAGAAQRAFVSCSQMNTVLVFNPADLSAAPQRIEIAGEDPRAMAVSPDGASVYVAVFESGNNTTILGGGRNIAPPTMPGNVVSRPDSPYGGLNPPPNDGDEFMPPMNPDNPPPPKVSLIVRKNEHGRWMDDNAHDWTDFVSGDKAWRSARPEGWDLLDHDLAVIDTATLGVSYARGLMNICMSVAVHPKTGIVSVVGTEAFNEIRFEPNLTGRFGKVQIALVDPAAARPHGPVQSRPDPAVLRDLNPHLTYDGPSVPPALRALSVADPRAIAWESSGERAYVAGLGSNNVVIVDADGQRLDDPPIAVGQGPSGLVLDEPRGLLYVLNRFEATVSIVSLAEARELGRVGYFDPTPAPVRRGRAALYGTQRSGTGHVSCAFCHVDARIDRLAWDLGDPTAPVKPFNQNCNFEMFKTTGDALPCEDWHPMKGPMLTQTFQDIIGKEPFHWRGDREGLEAFNVSFVDLLGADYGLTTEEMEDFKALLATIQYPPNPYRNFDNSLPTDLPLPRHHTTGRFAPAGQPLPNGDAVAGLEEFRTGIDDQGIFSCVTCHSLPTAFGTDLHAVAQDVFEPYPPGPNGENHVTVNSVNRSTNNSTKIPQLRNLYDRVGFDTTQRYNLAGFGFLHDGSVDSIERFVSEPVFDVASDQEYANMTAFMLAFSGSDLPLGTTDNFRELLGPASKDTHAAVGAQVTFGEPHSEQPGAAAERFDQMTALADRGVVGLIAAARVDGVPRGYAYLVDGVLQSDRMDELTTVDALRSAAAPGAEVTFTVVVAGTQTRLGIDRDEDGFLDGDETLACCDPDDPTSTPLHNWLPAGDVDHDGLVDLADLTALLLSLNWCAGDAAFVAAADLDDSGCVDVTDLALFIPQFGSVCPWHPSGSGASSFSHGAGAAAANGATGNERPVPGPGSAAGPTNESRRTPVRDRLPDRTPGGDRGSRTTEPPERNP